MYPLAKVKFLLRQFPFLYPSKIIHSCQEWINDESKRKGHYYKLRGPWYQIIFPQSFIHNSSPQTLGSPNEKAFYNNKDYQTDNAILFHLQNSYLLGHKGLVLTARHQVFQEFSHHFGISSLKKFFFKNPFYTFSKYFKKVNGVGAVLISPESHNYYHWLNDVLPRIRLYESVLDKIDYFCISSKVPAKFIDLLTNFNISKDKVLLVNDVDKLHFDHLYVASLPGSEGRSPLWAVEYVRNKLLTNSAIKQLNKKIYFKRGPNTERKILNEDAIIAQLENIGFEIIDPDDLSVYQQITLMQQAQIVVSAHGAALSNLLFSPVKIPVIELFTPDYFRTDCYYTLSSLLQLNYWYIIGSKSAIAGWGDIIVDEALLLNTIKKADINNHHHN